MSKTRRGLAVLASAAIAVPLWAVPAAQAAPVKEPASNGAYFSATGAPDTGTDAGKLPPVTRPADGVKEGNLAVSARGGQADKQTYLMFALSDLVPGQTITKAELRVPTVPNGDGNVVIAPAAVKVQACPSGPEGFSNESGESLTVAPKPLCEQAKAPGKDSADKKAYVFDLTQIASGWADMNDGVALVPAPGADSTNFQVVFAAAEQAVLTYEATAAPPEDTGLDSGAGADFGTDSGTAGGEVPADDSGSADLGGGFVDAGGFDAGATDSVPADAGGFGAVDSPLISADVPVDAAGPAPAVEEPVAAEDPTAVAAPAANNVGFTSSSDPTAGFWLAGLLFAALLALISLVMGDPSVARSTTKESRLSQALSARQAGGGRGVSL